MRALRLLGLFLALTEVCGLVSCNLPGLAPAADRRATAAAATLSALETAAVIRPTQAAAVVPQTATATSTASPPETPAPTQTPQSPLVMVDALCWVGPGNAYEVVSAIRSGTRVQLLGRGTIPGWYVVKNPIYGDPCWIRASDVQVDIGTNLASLPSFSPPPTPTETPHPEPSPTNTP